SQLKVHQGFLASFKVTAAQILTVVQNLHAQYPHYHLDVVGQSLGGVHATMLATHLGEGRQAGTLLASSTRITLTHYGRPRVGNLAFVHHFRSLNLINRRVTSRNDLVSRIPFRHLGFVHENDEYWLDTHGK
ncbi:Alpha/Beta hydrolase protein, partial [Dimargaris cristalligena]